MVGVSTALSPAPLEGGSLMSGGQGKVCLCGDDDDDVDDKDNDDLGTGHPGGGTRERRGPRENLRGASTRNGSTVVA